MLRAVAWRAGGAVHHGGAREYGRPRARARPALGPALTGDLGLLAGIAGVAGVARVEDLLRAGQVLVRLLRHPWKAGRKQG